MAKLFQVAAVAFGFAGVADLAAMVDDLVGEIDPPLLSHDPHQLPLDLLRCVAVGQPEAVGDAKDVRIHHYAFSLAEADAEDDAGGLAGRAGNGGQLGERFRNPAAELLDYLAGRALDGLGLVAEEAG